jgi:hypothetical protein
MKKTMVGFTFAILLALAAAAAYAQQSVAGNWELSVQNMTIPMVLVQDGEKITGTLDTPHGLIPVKGELSKGKLKLTGDATDSHPIELLATATLNPDGSLSGTISANSMEMSFTAVRSAK